MSENKTGEIYLVRSKVTGKMYIGQTCRSFDIRWKQHCADNSNSRSYNDHFHKAIRLYGIDNWDYKILKIFSCSSKELLKKQLDASEIKYIALYDTFKNVVRILGRKWVNLDLERRMVCMVDIELKRRKKIYVKSEANQLDLDGNFIKRWDSCKEAQKSGYKNINRVLYGKNKQCKGYKWEWAQK